jgi:hypothetical protein
VLLEVLEHKGLWDLREEMVDLLDI